MTLEELKNNWKSDNQSDIQARMWDKAALDFAKKPLPDINNNEFLKLLFKLYPINNETKILDIGCGTGGYSLALAPFINSATGIDISGEMIRIAKNNLYEAKINNVEFLQLDWSNTDIDKLNYRSNFDIVFAHMSPAVNDFATLDKMDACAKKFCIIDKPSRRINAVLDEVMRLVGIDPIPDETGIQNIFSYLWCKGYEPKFEYEKQIWEAPKSLENMIAWCTDRAELKKKLSLDDKKIIKEYLESIAADGMVNENTKVTKVTVIWNKE